MNRLLEQQTKGTMNRPTHEEAGRQARKDQPAAELQHKLCTDHTQCVPAPELASYRALKRLLVWAEQDPTGPVPPGARLWVQNTIRDGLGLPTRGWAMEPETVQEQESLEKHAVALAERLEIVNSQLRDREHLWMFGGAVLDLCLQKVGQMREGELPLDALRRWFDERDKLDADSQTLRQELEATFKRYKAVVAEKEAAWEVVDQGREAYANAIAERDKYDVIAQKLRRDLMAYDYTAKDRYL